MMECPQKTGDAAEWMIAYAARTLDPDQEAAFECHLELCPSCREAAVAQRAVWSALDDLAPVPVSANFDARLYRRIAEERNTSWWQGFYRADWSWQPALQVAVAGAVLMAAFLVKDLGNPGAPQKQPKLQIEQVESALDDMEMLKQAGVESVIEKTSQREQI